MVGLVDVGDLDGVAYLKCACVGGLLAHDEAEEGGLAGSVGADDSDNAALGEGE